MSLANKAVGGSEKVKPAVCLCIIGIKYSSATFTLILLPQCLAVVRQAFAAVEEALMGGNVSQVAVDFGCCQIPKDPDDQVKALIFFLWEASANDQKATCVLLLGLFFVCFSSLIFFFF